MTRTLFMLAGLLLIVLVGLFIVGVASNAPIALITAILCALPLCMMALGAALGRASNEFAVVKKNTQTAARATTTQRRPVQQEHLG